MRLPKLYKGSRNAQHCEYCDCTISVKLAGKSKSSLHSDSHQRANHHVSHHPPSLPHSTRPLPPPDSHPRLRRPLRRNQQLDHLTRRPGPTQRLPIRGMELHQHRLLLHLRAEQLLQLRDLDHAHMVRCQRQQMVPGHLGQYLGRVRRVHERRRVGDVQRSVECKVVEQSHYR
jgi:hypothetical protein